MKRHISTIVLLAIILLGIFFIVGTALGLVVITGENIDINFNPVGGDLWPLCQSFKLDTVGTTTVEEVIVRGYYDDDWGGTKWTYMSLHGPYNSKSEADDDYGQYGSCHEISESKIVWSELVEMPLDVMGDTILSVDEELTGGKWYYVFITKSGGTTNDQQFIGGTANGYPDGTLAIRTGGDLNGATQIALSLTLPPSDSIGIIYPENESTPPYDFSNWIVEFTTATSTTATSTDYYIKEVYVGSTTSTIVNLSGGESFGESPLDVSNNLIFNSGYTYYAQARLVWYEAGYFNTVATSSIISFTPSYEAETEIEEGLYPMPISTSTSEFWTFTCDPESGFFQNSLCNLARFLFVPTQLSVRNLVDLKDDIADKPPIGYFSLIKDALSNLSATGTPAFTLVGVEALETDFLDKIKDGIKIILYLVFGFWLLKRVTTFDFHT